MRKVFNRLFSFDPKVFITIHAPQLTKYASQLLKKVAQATPKGLLHLLVLDPHKLSNRLFSFDPFW